MNKNSNYNSKKDQNSAALDRSQFNLFKELSEKRIIQTHLVYICGLDQVTATEKV